MAGVAVPRDLFQRMLRLIDGLRPRPAPLEGAPLEPEELIGEARVDDAQRVEIRVGSRAVSPFPVDRHAEAGFCVIRRGKL